MHRIFWIFFLLGVLLVSYICGLVSIINFRKFEVIISSDTSFSSLFLFLLVFPYVYVTSFLNCPTVLEYSVLPFKLFCFPLCT